jgi:hypothetical protein
MNIELDKKLDLLHAQLAVIAGARGVEALQEMGDATATVYLTGCRDLAWECFEAATAAPTGGL